MWTKNVFISVFSRISANGKIRLLSKYPNASFTNSTPKARIKSFPTIIITDMSAGERGNTFEGNIVNATQSNIQVEVITNTSQDDADYVADVCYDLISDMSYSATMKPTSNSSDYGTYRNTARYTRTVANGDII